VRHIRLSGSFVERVVRQARYGGKDGEAMDEISKRVWKSYGGEVEQEQSADVLYKKEFERLVRKVLSALPSVFRVEGSRYWVDPQNLEVSDGTD
jgi:hypothetical protein